MANVKEIRERIASIEETRKITNAMYLISSSKMKQSKAQLAKTEPFFFAMQREIARLLYCCPDVISEYFNQRKNILKEERKVGIIVLSSDKGLAGAYNHNVIKEAEKLMKEYPNYKLFVFGEYGRHYFARKNKDHMDLDFRFAMQNLALHRARATTDLMQELFIEKDLDDIYIVYTQTVGLSAQTEKIKLLPLKKDNFKDDGTLEIPASGINFYPTPEDVMEAIVPNYMNGIVYGCLAEAFYSEHCARMLAMQNATNSAEDMLDELDMTYNRVRQANITQELTEVVAGANAQQRK